MMNGIIKSSIFTQQDTVNLLKNNLDTLTISKKPTVLTQPRGSKDLLYKSLEIRTGNKIPKDTIVNHLFFMKININDKSLIDNYKEGKLLSLNQDSNCYIVNKHTNKISQQLFHIEKNEDIAYTKKDFVIKEKISMHNDWTIIPILLCLLLLASIVTRYRKYLTLLFESIVYRFSNSKILNEKNNQILRLTIVLDILYILSFSLTIDQIVNDLGFFSAPEKFPYIIFVAFLSFLLILRLFRYIVFKLSALFSNHKNFFKELFKGSLLYTRALGLFLLPLVVLVTYSTGLINLILIYFTLFTLFIILIMRFINMFRTFIVRGFSIFYFILYLCALEIVPLLILWKEVKSR